VLPAADGVTIHSDAPEDVVRRAIGSVLAAPADRPAAGAAAASAAEAPAT
jgi:hypothetical protein